MTILPRRRCGVQTTNKYDFTTNKTILFSSPHHEFVEITIVKYRNVSCVFFVYLKYYYPLDYGRRVAIGRGNRIQI